MNPKIKNALRDPGLLIYSQKLNILCISLRVKTVSMSESKKYKMTKAPDSLYKTNFANKFLFAMVFESNFFFKLAY